MAMSSIDYTFKYNGKLRINDLAVKLLHRHFINFISFKFFIKDKV